MNQLFQLQPAEHRNFITAWECASVDDDIAMRELETIPESVHIDAT